MNFIISSNIGRFDQEKIYKTYGDKIFKIFNELQQNPILCSKEQLSLRKEVDNPC